MINYIIILKSFLIKMLRKSIEFNKLIKNETCNLKD